MRVIENENMTLTCIGLNAAMSRATGAGAAKTVVARRTVV